MGLSHKDCRPPPPLLNPPLGQVWCPGLGQSRCGTVAASSCLKHITLGFRKGLSVCLCLVSPPPASVHGPCRRASGTVGLCSTQRGPGLRGRRLAGGSAGPLGCGTGGRRVGARGPCPGCREVGAGPGGGHCGGDRPVFSPQKQTEWELLTLKDWPVRDAACHGGRAHPASAATRRSHARRRRASPELLEASPPAQSLPPPPSAPGESRALVSPSSHHVGPFLCLPVDKVVQSLYS